MSQCCQVPSVKKIPSLKSSKQYTGSTLVKQRSAAKHLRNRVTIASRLFPFGALQRLQAPIPVSIEDPDAEDSPESSDEVSSEDDGDFLDAEEMFDSVCSRLHAKDRDLKVLDGCVSHFKFCELSA